MHAAFANEPREPEDELNPSLRAALFLENDQAVLDLLRPREGNLVDRLASQTDCGAAAEELYLSVLTRRPTPEEAAHFAGRLAGKSGDERKDRLTDLYWTLLNTTEFSWNH